MHFRGLFSFSCNGFQKKGKKQNLVKISLMHQLSFSLELTTQSIWVKPPIRCFGLLSLFFQHQLCWLFFPHLSSGVGMGLVVKMSTDIFVSSILANLGPSWRVFFWQRSTHTVWKQLLTGPCFPICSSNAVQKFGSLIESPAKMSTSVQCFFFSQNVEEGCENAIYFFLSIQSIICICPFPTPPGNCPPKDLNPTLTVQADLSCLRFPRRVHVRGREVLPQQQKKNPEAIILLDYSARENTFF